MALLLLVLVRLILQIVRWLKLFLTFFLESCQKAARKQQTKREKQFPGHKLQTKTIIRNIEDSLPFLRRSTKIGCPSSLLHMIFGVGKPFALQVKLIFWFSRIAIVDCVLSVSRIFGGTRSKKKQCDWIISISGYLYRKQVFFFRKNSYVSAVANSKHIPFVCRIGVVDNFRKIML